MIKIWRKIRCFFMYHNGQWDKVLIGYDTVVKQCKECGATFTEPIK